MRSPPKFSYKGLTVVLSNPSRFDIDNKELLSGYAGIFFNNQCLRPTLNRWQCDIRTVDNLKAGSLLPDTKLVLLLGDKAFKTFSYRPSETSTIGEQRGSPLKSTLADSVHTMCSFSPQDCMDVKDYEAELNPQYETYTTQEKGSSDDKRRHGITARQNWKFFLEKDTKKLLSLLPEYKGELLCPPPRLDSMGNISSMWEKSSYEIYPKSQEIINWLTYLRNENLYLDIETDSNLNITVLSLAIDNGPIFTVPFLRWNYANAYSNVEHILRSLAKALTQNTIVVHNAMFDLFVLTWKYKLPIGFRVYDTMIAQHRCFPDVEKSLGHCTSLWTWEPFHKDEGFFEPKNEAQEQSLWVYNAKDVFTMRLIKQAIDKYAEHDKGLQDSIAQGNSQVYPYLVNTLFGIRFDKKKVEEIKLENDRLMIQYLRIIKLLTGGIDLLPTSNSQMPWYFHDMLSYKVIGKTPKGKPQLDEKNLLELKLHNDNNPLIDLCLAYRAKSKETGSLKFKPWQSAAS